LEDIWPDPAASNTDQANHINHATLNFDTSRKITKFVSTIACSLHTAVYQDLFHQFLSRILQETETFELTVAYLLPMDSICPTIGGHHPGVCMELIHSANDNVGIVCGYSHTASPSAYASISVCPNSSTITSEEVSLPASSLLIIFGYRRRSEDRS
jgi:hypothetical protein